MRVWASLGLVFALDRRGLTPGQLSHFTSVSFPNTLGPSALRVFPQAFEYSSLGLLVLSSLPFAFPAVVLAVRLSYQSSALTLMPSLEGSVLHHQRSAISL